jgi:hypothetical protein
MKSQLLSVALVMATFPAHGALIASWNQDEALGDLIDGAGLNPNAVIVTGGLVDYGQPGVPNGGYGALSVTAAAGTSIGYGPNLSDDYFISGSANTTAVQNIDRTGSFTVMSWMNPLMPDIARTYRPVSTGSGAGVDRGWGFGLRLPDTAGNATIRFTTYGVADNDSVPITVVFGEWIHIAATYNNGAIDYYFNGTLLGGSDVSLFGNEGANARLSIGARIGALAGGAGGNDGDQVSGRLDGVRVYDSVLTPAEIQLAAVESVSVPEPTVAAIACLGAFGLIRRRRA